MAATLYYTATSCGAASYIAAHVGGLIESGKVVAHKVDIGPAKKITSTGASFTAVNPKGNVPALVLPCGTLLNEGAATLQWLGDAAPASGLVPAAGTTARYVLINHLNFLASELHASYGPLFGPGDDAFKTAQRAKAATKIAMAEALLGDKHFLLGDVFSVADSYLYIILSWSGYVGIDLTPFAKLNAFSERVKAMPKVAEAHAAMNAAA